MFGIPESLLIYGAFAFGALMVATNVVNNALGVPLDGNLEPYRKQPNGSGGGA